MDEECRQQVHSIKLKPIGDQDKQPLPDYRDVMDWLVREMNVNAARGEVLLVRTLNMLLWQAISWGPDYCRIVVEVSGQRQRQMGFQGQN